MSKNRYDTDVSPTRVLVALKNVGYVVPILEEQVNCSCSIYITHSEAFAKDSYEFFQVIMSALIQKVL